MLSIACFSYFFGLKLYFILLGNNHKYWEYFFSGINMQTKNYVSVYY